MARQAVFCILRTLRLVDSGQWFAVSRGRISGPGLADWRFLGEICKACLSAFKRVWACLSVFGRVLPRFLRAVPALKHAFPSTPHFHFWRKGHRGLMGHMGRMGPISAPSGRAGHVSPPFFQRASHGGILPHKSGKANKKLSSSRNEAGRRNTVAERPGSHAFHTGASINLEDDEGLMGLRRRRAWDGRARRRCRPG